jgi:hypothetical protein
MFKTPGHRLFLVRALIGLESARGQAHVSRHVRPAEIRGKRHDDDGREAVPVQGVALNDYDRTAKARCRAPGWRQVRPENVALRDCYHSTSRRTR